MEAILIGDAQTRECAYRALAESQKAAGFGGTEMIVLRKTKCQVSPRTGHEGPEQEYRFGCTLSLTSAVDGVGGRHHTPVPLLPENIPGSIV
jgi:hypothetical protein